MKKLRGFTLIELMVSLSIVAVLVTLAAPSVRSMVQSSAMTSTVNGFIADMRFARSESIRRGGQVIMCRSNAPEASAPVCDGSTSPDYGWVTGWIIFHDEGKDGAFTNGTDTILRVQGPIKNVNTMVSNKTAYKYSFSATGRLPVGNASQIQFGSTPDYSNESQRVICVNVGGHARIAGDGLVDCP